MPKRTLAFVFAALAAIVLLHHPEPVHAQSAQLQIASITLGPPQTLSYPDGPVTKTAASTQYLYFFPDELMTFMPPASSGGLTLLFGAGTLSTNGLSGTTVLQSTDLVNWTFATGYQPLAIVPPVNVWVCNPTYDQTSYDESYAGSGFVAQDPTLPAGNLVMLYEAENHCAGGVPNTNGLASVGFARSADNGMTWPAPVNSLTGGPLRYPVVEADTVPVTTAGGTLSNYVQEEGGYIDKSLDGNYYLYSTYQHVTVGNGAGVNVAFSGPRFARAPLGQNPLVFQKWYNGSFSQPGVGGLDSPGAWLSQSCGAYAQLHSISHVDDLGLYLLTFNCQSSTGGGNTWYYSTATSLDLQDWTAPQPITGAQFAATGSAAACDGFLPSWMSPGEAPGHLHLTGNAFYTCDNGSASTGGRVLTSRSFTINTQPQPAPVLTSGSVANGATYLSGGLVAGSWAQVQGTGLSNVTRIWTGFDFLNLGNNLPTNLSGVQVTVNGTPAPVYYISPTQIDFQVPSGVSGNASVQVVVNGTGSNKLTASASANSPGLFPNTVNGVNYPAAVYASGTFVGPSGVAGYLPASVGYHVSLFATGLTAEPAGVIPTAAQINGVTVTVGNTVIPADYAGQTPYVGEFQINFTLPESMATLPAGNYPISITYNGVSSPTLIGNPPAPIVLPFVPPSN